MTLTAAIALAGCSSIGGAADSLNADAQAATAASELGGKLNAEKGVTSASSEFQPLAGTGRTLTVKVALEKDATDAVWTAVAKDLADALEDDRLDDVIPAVTVTAGAEKLTIADARALSGTTLNAEVASWRTVSAAAGARIGLDITAPDDSDGASFRRGYTIIAADIPTLTGHWPAVVAATGALAGSTGWTSDGFSSFGTPPVSALLLLGELTHELPIMTVTGPAAKDGSVALAWNDLIPSVAVFSPAKGELHPTAAAVRAMRTALGAGLPRVAVSWNGRAAGALSASASARPVRHASRPPTTRSCWCCSSATTRRSRPPACRPATASDPTADARWRKRRAQSRPASR